MKKIVSIVLTIVMVVSTVTMVSAATVNDLITFLPNPVEVDMTVDVLARENGTNVQHMESFGIIESNPSAGVGIDYKSTLDMEPIRLLFDRNLIASAMNGDVDAMEEFEEGIVATEISVKITYPATAVFSGDLNTVGVLDAGEIFSEVSRTPAGNTLTIVYKNRDNLTVAELADHKEEYLKDIAFYLDDTLSYNATGEYLVEVEMEGETVVTFDSKVQNFKYNGADSCRVSISTPAHSGSSVSGLIEKKPVIKFESNGGEEFKDIVVSSKDEIVLPTPTQDGFVFDGWYIDEELTVPFNPEMQLDDTVTLYAKWNKVADTPVISHKTPDALNGEDHFAYVLGYPDGTVRPNDNIIRSEATAIFFRLLKNEIREANLTDQSSFDDVAAGDWFNKAVATMEKLGIIRGRDEKLFVPDGYITRAEFAAICARFDDSEYEVVDEFTDVSGHWAENEIHEAAAYGWINGYEDGTFRPDQLITRAEAMTMINRVLNRVPETKDDLHSDMIVWPDNANPDVWYYIPVQEATNSHVYEMKNDIYEKWTGLMENTDWTMYQ